MTLLFYVLVVVCALAACGVLIERFVLNRGRHKRPCPSWLIIVSASSSLMLLALVVVWFLLDLSTH